MVGRWVGEGNLTVGIYYLRNIKLFERVAGSCTIEYLTNFGLVQRNCRIRPKIVVRSRKIVVLWRKTTYLSYLL